MIRLPLLLALSLAILGGCAGGEEAARRCGGCILPSPPRPMRPVVTVEPVAAADSVRFDWDLVARAVEYPDFARRAGIEGVVRVAVTVASPGRLVGLELVSESGTTDSAHELLTRAALAGLVGAPYRPGPMSKVVVEADVGFRLDW